MITISARDVLNLKPEELLHNYPRMVDVVYDDNQVVTSSIRKLVYCWYIWEFHREYPFLPLVHDHHLDSILNGQLLSQNTHINLLTKITKQLIYSHNLDSHEDKEKILSIIYKIVNNLHNELTKITDRYVATIDITDILAIANDNAILALKADTQPNASSMADFYSYAHKIILEDPKHRKNNLVQFIRMGILNLNQVNQCVLARGFPIEVTGIILNTPIMSNYAQGMHLLYDYVGDSRTASKAAYSAESPLQDTEYFARRLQLSSMVVKGIIKDDCGTKKYLPWFVKPPIYTSTGRQVYAGDLRFMRGKNYIEETTGEIKQITGKENHLIGKHIYLRSILFCQEPNPHYVCSTCFGGLYHNVSRFANLGHLCSATLTHQLTQTILSTKHVIGSAVGSGSDLQLREDARKYIQFNFNNSSFYLKPMNPKSKYKMIVNRNQAIGLTDLKLLNNLDEVNPKRISALETVYIQELTENGLLIEIPIKIIQNKRNGYFSYEFLKYIQEKGWHTNEYDHFIFDLSEWSNRFPVISIPDVEYSYADHADEIAKIIESNTGKLHSRARGEAPSEIIQELFDKTNSKINVNLAVLEVLIYAVMTPGIDDYGMARNKENSGLHVARYVISNRSLAPAYAYENQFKKITHPRSFFMENRPDSPIDVFLTPREVVENLKNNSQ